MPGFFDIKAWQKADDLAVAIYQATESFPKDQRYRLVDQMQRAAVSVPANISEGSGRRTVRDFLRFLYMANGSLREVEYYIHLAKRLNYLSEADSRTLTQVKDETARVLFGFIRFKEEEANKERT